MPARAAPGAAAASGSLAGLGTALSATFTKAAGSAEVAALVGAGQATIGDLPTAWAAAVASHPATQAIAVAPAPAS